jgi:large subunit ribosomal protein L6
MSRIGRQAIPIPKGVTIERHDGLVQVRGPKGQLGGKLPPTVEMEVAAEEVTFARTDERKTARAHHGLARAMVANMVRGVTQGFVRDLIIEGVGYRAEIAGKKLTLALGFSHPVVVEVPEGLSVSVEGVNKIKIEGIDREKVGQFAAELRNIRPPEPYKGKGVRYADERIRRKVGKAGAGA